VGGGRRGRGKGGEMTQTLYAHMNKKNIKKRTPPTTNVGNDVWKKEPSDSPDRNVSLYNY
jgi:hypothetical protein